MKAAFVVRPLGHSPRFSRQTFSGRTLLSSRATSLGSSPAKVELTWPEYLAIRRNKRRWETAVTIPCALLGFAGGILYFGTLESDPTKPIFGMDPLIFYGLCTVGCVGAGVLIGPTIGAACWRITHRKAMEMIEAREREFYRRIQKYRVDPTAQSATNPVPDFYGEKIGSLSGYRQWLKDQAKYRRKAVLPEE